MREPCMSSCNISRQRWHARQLAPVGSARQHQPRQQRSLPLDDTHDACSPRPGIDMDICASMDASVASQLGT